MENSQKVNAGIRERPSPLTLSIVIPVRNDGLNLKIMLKILSATVEVDHELLIVSESTEDESHNIVGHLSGNNPRVKFILNSLGPGVGHAICAGINESRGKYILILTADDIGPVLQIAAMCELMDQGYEFICPTRYALGGQSWGGSSLNRLLSRLANILFYGLVDTPITDSTLGIKMFRRSIIKKINLTSTVGWTIGIELSIKAHIYNLKTAQIPIISINRFYGGKSNFKLVPWIFIYCRLFAQGIFELYDARQLRFQTIFKKS
ncbi:MAG: glycosyltransferase [Candidatus Omnitrophica bacterium]|nr:glycosyltransferase [Candidatus Omnitrophota bacterium]